jgi:hypothetical protein
MSFPITATESGESGTLGFRNSAVMSLPPSWPQAREVRTTAWDCAVPPVTVLPGGVVPAIVACALRW